MQSSQQLEQLSDFIKKIKSDKKHKFFTDPDSPYNKNPHLAALIDKAIGEMEAIEKSKQELAGLEKSRAELQQSYQKSKERFIDELGHKPITIDLSRKNSSNIYRFHNHRNKTELTPLLENKTDSEFDCCKIIKKIFGF